VVQGFQLPFHSWASNEASSLLLKKSMLLCSPAISSLQDRRTVLINKKHHTQHVVCKWFCACSKWLYDWGTTALPDLTWVYSCFSLYVSQRYRHIYDRFCPINTFLNELKSDQITQVVENQIPNYVVQNTRDSLGFHRFHSKHISIKS
jgi:hypothetical protein